MGTEKAIRYVQEGALVAAHKAITVERCYCGDSAQSHLFGSFGCHAWAGLNQPAPLRFGHGLSTSAGTEQVEHQPQVSLDGRDAGADLCRNLPRL